MLIVKKVTKNLNGDYDVNWQLTEDQMAFLLTFAINSLVAEGLVQIDENDGSQLALFEPDGRAN